jgi:hypothetical protein
LPRDTARASVPLLCAAVRLALPPSHHPVPGLSPPLGAVPFPSPPLPLPADAEPEPAPRDGTSESVAVGRRPLVSAPEAGYPFCEPPFVGPLCMPGALHMLGALDVSDPPGAPCVLGASGIGPGPEAPPEDPLWPECGRSKSSPVASVASAASPGVGRSAGFLGRVGSVAFVAFAGWDGGVGCGGTGARRASVLMHPPFPRTRATVCSHAGRRAPALARIRTGVHPALTRHDTKTKSSRARIPAAADRHPGRGRTTGGDSSVRARHSTGCPHSNGNQSTPPGHLPGTSPYPAVIESGRLRA